ncbi:MAG TPA: protein kinase, partial [Planctomycetaceae bacterium]|nr:protein kinase [Planctomycetaceae bacterium]
PEQASGEGHASDGRSDVYSLGVVLFELLTGERPFRGNTQALLYQTVNSDTPSPRTLNRRVSRDLEAVCLKALARDPNRRYASARDFAEDLRRILSGEPVKARPGTLVSKVWRWSQHPERIRDTGRITMFVGLLLFGWALVGATLTLIGVYDSQARRLEALAWLAGYSALWIFVILVGIATIRYNRQAIWLGLFMGATLVALTLLMLLTESGPQMGGLFGREQSYSPLYSLLAMLALIMFAEFIVALIAYHSNPHVVRWARTSRSAAKTGEPHSTIPIVRSRR